MHYEYQIASMSRRRFADTLLNEAFLFATARCAVGSLFRLNPSAPGPATCGTSNQKMRRRSSAKFLLGRRSIKTQHGTSVKQSPGAWLVPVGKLRAARPVKPRLAVDSTVGTAEGR